MSFISPAVRPVVISVACSDGNVPASAARKGYHKVPLGALNSESLSTISPTVVMAWLYCKEYDIHDVAERLKRARYKGKLVAMSSPLPSKAMICAEIRAAYPELLFDLSFSTPLSPESRAYQESLERP